MPFKLFGDRHKQIDAAVDKAVNGTPKTAKPVKKKPAKKKSLRELYPALYR